MDPVGSTSRTVHTASCATTIFPEHDDSCYVDIQADAIYGMRMRKPLGYDSEKQLAGLVTLKGFMNGGHEVSDARVLVFVKSIGGLKKCTTRAVRSISSRADFATSPYQTKQQSRPGQRERFRRHM